METPFAYSRSPCRTWSRKRRSAKRRGVPARAARIFSSTMRCFGGGER
jgi:hypothetical protein